MEAGLELDEQPDHPFCPGGCFEETPEQRMGEKWGPLSRKPGPPQRDDSEYPRQGVGNLFLVFQPAGGGGMGISGTIVPKKMLPL